MIFIITVVFQVTLVIHDNDQLEPALIILSLPIISLECGPSPQLNIYGILPLSKLVKLY